MLRIDIFWIITESLDKVSSSSSNIAETVQPLTPGQEVQSLIGLDWLFEHTDSETEKTKPVTRKFTLYYCYTVYCFICINTSAFVLVVWSFVKDAFWSKEFAWFLLKRILCFRIIFFYWPRNFCWLSMKYISFWVLLMWEIQEFSSRYLNFFFVCEVNKNDNVCAWLNFALCCSIL